MSVINVPWVAFNGGEIGQEAMARVDLDPYPSTCETMENIFPLLQGGMMKAPGSEYIGRSYLDSAAIVRPFIFNVSQTRVLEISDSRMVIVDGDAYVDIDGAAATVGSPADNGSTGGSAVVDVSNNVTFTTVAGGEARVYWPITAGVNGTPTTMRFEIERRPLLVSVGTTVGAEDILAEVTLDPGVHVLSFTPTAASYYFRARLQEVGKAVLKGLTRLAAGEFVIPTPWLEADLPGLRYRQSLDTYWLYHPNYRTRVLERRGNTSWSLRLFRPPDGPFENPNTTAITLAPSAVSGSITVAANAAFFSAEKVGQLLEITHSGQLETQTYSAEDQTTDSIRVTGIGVSRSFQVVIGGSFTGDTLELQRSAGNELDWVLVQAFTATDTVTIDDGLDNQIIYYRVICTTYGSGSPTATLTYAGGETTGRCEIVAYTSPVEVTAEVLEEFGAISATTNWSQGAWSDDLGWPAAGTIDDGRHLIIRDDRFWASAADDYESFLIGVDAADAIAKRFGTGDMNAGRWIEGGSRTLIGTSGAEFDVRSNAVDDGITPDNVRLKGFDDNGSYDAQACRIGGGRVAFIDRTRAKVMQCLLDPESSNDQFTTDDLTAMHEDIAGVIDEAAGTGGFVEIAFQKRPQPRLWCVRDDGQMAVILADAKRGVFAWCRLTAANGGAYRSVCCVPGSPEDRVHVIVEREINGETRVYHERIAPVKFVVETDEDGRETAPLAWRLQCALSSTGEPTDSFSAADHLEGETVSIWADGRVHPPRKIVGGAFTLEWEATTIIMGLNYDGKWKSGKLAYGAQLGTALTMDKNLNRLGAIVRQTPRGAFKYGRTFATCSDELAGETDDNLLMDAAVQLWSEENNQPFDGTSDIDARVCILMDTPAPVTILALIPGMELHEVA